MNKEEIILKLLESLNMGNSGYSSPANCRVEMAIAQYNELVNNGVIKG